VRVNPNWGTVQVILAARKFSGDTPQEQWLRVMNFLDDELKAQGPGLTQGISLTIRTFDQIQENGEFTLNPGFVEIDELLGPGPGPVPAGRDTL
jgi:hypothetical protein